MKIDFKNKLKAFLGVYIYFNANKLIYSNILTLVTLHIKKMPQVF